MNHNRSRLPMPTGGAGLIVFLAVAAVLAVFVARIAGVVLRVAGQLLWYAVAFAVAVTILSWVWGRFAGNRNRAVERWEDRDEYGRRRY